jgi:hypothetical protein
VNRISMATFERAVKRHRKALERVEAAERDEEEGADGDTLGEVVAAYEKEDDSARDLAKLACRIYDQCVADELGARLKKSKRKGGAK